MHFNLTEIYTREIRKLLLPLQNTQEPSNQGICNDIFEMIFSKFSRIQADYDQETNHSLDIKAQIRWNKIVMEKLTSLNAYEENAYSSKIANNNPQKLP